MNNESTWRCETCKHWKQSLRTPAYGECTNEWKIHEDYGSEAMDTDHMIYSYLEGGRFTTGKDFGCVHFSQTNLPFWRVLDVSGTIDL